MDEYDWQKNKAIVDRLYYTERLWETTVFAGLCYTATNMLYAKQNYFAATCRARIAPFWMYCLAFNSAITFILVKPLRRDEIEPQIKKRLVMGKWLQGTYHLDEDCWKYGDLRLV